MRLLCRIIGHRLTRREDICDGISIVTVRYCRRCDHTEVARVLRYVPWTGETPTREVRA